MPTPAPSDLAARRRALGALALLAIGWLALFSPQLVTHRVFVAGDATLYRRFSEFSRDRWQHEHRRTFWNPYVFLGLPSTASLADQRPQFLPDRLLDGWERWRGRPQLPPLAGPLLAHALGVLAMALLARALWNARPTAMLWAGWAWLLLPALLVPLTFGHDAQFASLTLIPVSLLLTHLLFASGAGGAAWTALALGALLAVQCLFGHPQAVAANGVMCAAFALERALHFRRPRRLAAAAGAALAGAVMSAPAWLPAMRYGALSVRGGSAGISALEVASFSHGWRDVLSLAWPWAVGFGGDTYWGALRKTDFPQFAGTLVCVVALFAWPRAARRERGTVLVFALLAALGLALSLGSNLPAVDAALRSIFPPFAAFRVPVAWLILTQIALILLSALGLERIAEPGAARNTMKHALRLAIVTGAFAVTTGFTLAWAPLHDVMAGWARAARPALSVDASVIAALHAELDLIWRGLLLAAAIAAWLASRRSKWAAWAATATLVLQIVDVGSVGVPFLLANSGPESRLAAAPAPPLALAAAADPAARAMPLDRAGASTNDWIAWRAKCVTGVHGAVDRDWSELLSAGFQRHYQALCAYAVRYTTMPAGSKPAPDLWSFVGGSASDSVVRLTHARDRAYWVPNVSVAGDRDQVLRALLSDEFRADQALAEETAVAGAYPGSTDATLRWLEDDPDRQRIATESSAPAFLVVADPLLPGWSGRIDGAPVAIHRVDFMLRGVVVPAGRHEIEMQYVPPDWNIAVAISRAAFLLTLAVGLAIAAWQIGFAEPASGANGAQAA